MISQKEILNIICTEAIEYAGLQEVPGRQHGARSAFHSAKREGRAREHNNGGGATPDPLPTVNHQLRLLKKADGTVYWKD